MSKGSYHHGDLRNALLDAVETIIEVEGLAAVSLRAAARHVGVSHAAPAHHFGDKVGLLSAFCVRGHQRFTASLIEARDSVADRPLAQRLAAVGRAYIDFALDERAYYEVMFRHELIDSSDEDVQESSGGAFGVLTSLIAEGVGTTDDDDPDVWRLSMTTWATVHGAASLWLQGTPQGLDGSLDLHTYVGWVIDQVGQGLRADHAWSDDSLAEG